MNRIFGLFSFLFSEFQIEMQVLARMKVTQCLAPLMRNPICRLLCFKGVMPKLNQSCLGQGWGRETERQRHKETEAERQRKDGPGLASWEVGSRRPFAVGVFGMPLGPLRGAGLCTGGLRLRLPPPPLGRWMGSESRGQGRGLWPSLHFP